MMTCVTAVVCMYCQSVCGVHDKQSAMQAESERRDAASRAEIMQEE